MKDSKSSKEDKKEQGFLFIWGSELKSIVLEEDPQEKEKRLYKRKLIRDMAKSPSVILKDTDAQYYDRTKNPQVNSVLR